MPCPPPPMSNRVNYLSLPMERHTVAIMEFLDSNDLFNSLAKSMLRCIQISCHSTLIEL